MRDRYEVMEYPVGIAYFAYGAAWVTQKVTGAGDVHARSDQPAGDLAGTAQVRKELRAFVIVNALGFAAMALLSAWLLAGVDRRRPWDAAAFAASPALLLTGLINWDMLAVVLVAGALFTWARGRPVATGVLVGLGTATKLYPLFLLGPIAIICLRERRYRDLVDTLLAAAASWFVLNAPAYLSGEDEWKRFWEFNSERGPDLGSVWLVVSQWPATRDLADHGQPLVLGAFGALVRRGRGGRLPRAEHAAAGAARLPRGRRLPAGQQGLLAAVRALAAAAGRAGPAALARPAGLAGVRGRLLRVGVVVPRRRPAARPAATTSGSTGSRS